eukprot:2932978-Lingulodinium_polyedra.AAC.1
MEHRPCRRPHRRWSGSASSLRWTRPGMRQRDGAGWWPAAGPARPPFIAKKAGRPCWAWRATRATRQTST